MLVFVDESGDPGLKLGKGSSDFFVLTLVIFTKNEDAHLSDSALDGLRTELGLGGRTEFKFNKLNDRGRRVFLTSISGQDFTYHSVVINKAKLRGKPFDSKESFYKHACKVAFTNCRQYLKDATIVIDGSGSRVFRQQLQTYLKGNINDTKDPEPCIKKVKIEDSKKNNLLQLADMICGAVARSYTTKKDFPTYRSLIEVREGSVQLWPK